MIKLVKYPCLDLLLLSNLIQKFSFCTSARKNSTALARNLTHPRNIDDVIKGLKNGTPQMKFNFVKFGLKENFSKLI